MRFKTLLTALVLLITLWVSPIASAQDTDKEGGKPAPTAMKKASGKKHSAAWYKKHNRPHSAAWNKKHGRTHSAAWYKKHKKP